MACKVVTAAASEAREPARVDAEWPMQLLWEAHTQDVLLAGNPATAGGLGVVTAHAHSRLCCVLAKYASVMLQQIAGSKERSLGRSSVAREKEVAGLGRMPKATPPVLNLSRCTYVTETVRRARRVTIQTVSRFVPEAARTRPAMVQEEGVAGSSVCLLSSWCLVGPHGHSRRATRINWRIECLVSLSETIPRFRTMWSRRKVEVCRWLDGGQTLIHSRRRGERHLSLPRMHLREVAKDYLGDLARGEKFTGISGTICGHRQPPKPWRCT